jgi:hypothetical protein
MFNKIPSQMLHQHHIKKPFAWKLEQHKKLEIESVETFK